MSLDKFTKESVLKVMEDFKKTLPKPFDVPFDYLMIVDVKIEEDCLIGILEDGDEFNIIHKSQVVL